MSLAAELEAAMFSAPLIENVSRVAESVDDLLAVDPSVVAGFLSSTVKELERDRFLQCRNQVQILRGLIFIF